MIEDKNRYLRDRMLQEFSDSERAASLAGWAVIVVWTLCCILFGVCIGMLLI